MKAFYKATANKRLWAWHRNRQVGAIKGMKRNKS
jgi:hypothetical protein